MAGSKETKEILKKPHEFITLSARALQWAREHARPLRFAGTGLAVAALIFLAASTYLGYADRKGQDAYNKAYNALSNQDGSAKANEAITEATGLFQEVIKDHGLSDASRLALVQVAGLKFREKKYDEAISMYQTFLDKMAGEPRYANLARFAMATCYEAKGDVKNAILLIQSVMDYPLLKESALWNLARLHRLSNEAEKEKEILKKFTEQFPDSPFLPLAKARL